MKPRGLLISGLILIFLLILSFSQRFITLDYKSEGKALNLEQDTVLSRANIKLVHFYKKYLVLTTTTNNLLIFRQQSNNSYKLLRQIELPEIVTHAIVYGYKNFIYFGFDNFISVFDFATDTSFVINLSIFNDTNHYTSLPVNYYYDTLVVFVRTNRHRYEDKKLVILNLKTNSVREIKLHCPDTISEHLCLFYTQLYHEKIYYSNRFSNFIWRYNLLTNKLDSLKANSDLIDSIPNHSFSEFFSLRYDKLLIDTINHKLWRVYVKPGTAIGGVIVDLNANRKVGEFVKPIPLIYSKTYGFIKENNKLKFVKYNYKLVPKFLWIKRHKTIFDQNPKEKACTISSSDSLSKILLFKYLHGFIFDLSNQKILIIPEKYSCPTCVDYISKIIQANLNLLKSKNFKCLWVGKDIQTPFAFISDTTFTIRDSSELFYKYFHLKSYNPILVYIKNGKIKNYKMFKPSNLSQFIYDILKQ